MSDNHRQQVKGNIQIARTLGRAPIAFSNYIVAEAGETLEKASDVVHGDTSSSAGKSPAKATVMRHAYPR
jgi:hypothetical protein